MACVGCGDDPDADGEPVLCERGHALCEACFDAHVKTESEKDVAALTTRDGEVRCPMRAAAFGDDACDAGCYEARMIARRCSKETFKAYDEARRRVNEAKIVDETERRVAAERARMRESAGADEKLRVTREHVIEKIFTTCCPRCSQAFVDFTGCFALSCSRCRAGICAYCLADCGKDAHAHIGSCAQAKAMSAWNSRQKKNKANLAATNRGHPAGTYGSTGMYEEAQRRRRLEMFALYSEHWDDAFLQSVLESLIREMKDLNISKEDITRARSARLKVNKAPPAPKPAPGRARQGRRAGVGAFAERLLEGAGEPFPLPEQWGIVFPEVRRRGARRAVRGPPNALEWALQLRDPAEDQGRLQAELRVRRAEEEAQRERERQRQAREKLAKKAEAEIRKKAEAWRIKGDAKTKADKMLEQRNLELAIRASMRTAADERRRGARRPVPLPDVAGPSRPAPEVVRIDESPPERLAARRNKRAKASKSQDTASKDSVIDLT